MHASLDRIRRLCIILSLLVAVPFLGRAIVAQEVGKNQPARCFLWKVTSKTTTVYLLGSMHMATADLFPLPKEIEDAYADSKSLVVEVNTEALDQAAVQKLILQKGLYPAGEKLSKNLSKPTLEKLEKYCARKKMQLAQLDPLRPWLVNLLVTVEEIKAAGLSEDGIDKHFLKKAKAQKKPIVEMETMEAQLELFAGLTPEFQEKQLAKTLTDSGDIKGEMEKMFAAWKAGDAKKMAAAMLSDPVKRHPESKALMVKMFDDRNVKMTEKIEGYLRGNSSSFVVVGAGHLVGDKGIVKLLEDKKYQIEQVMRTPAKK